MKVLLLQCIAACATDATEEAASPYNPRPPRVESGIAPGVAKMTPQHVEVATIGSYKVTFSVGDGGISQGGTILVDFPKAWFANPVPLIKQVQSHDRTAPHYVAVRASREDVVLELDIDHQSLDGSYERYRHIMEIKVIGAQLYEGDEIDVTFGNTTAPFISGKDRVRVAVDVDGSGRIELINGGADYEILPGEATSVFVTAPSQAVVGQAVDINVTLFDKFFNVARPERRHLELSGIGDDPIAVQVLDTAVVSWTPHSEGFFWPEVDGDFSAHGGPIRVTLAESDAKVFWGDIHSHTGVSKDGLGSNDYSYARDVTRLDFYAAAEHGGDDSFVAGLPIGDGITEAEWQNNVDLVRSFYEPGSFVPILAYECSFPSGHHNVYFRNLDGLPWPAYRLDSVQALWQMLDEGDAITIPHHLGIDWGKVEQDPFLEGLQTIETATSFQSGPVLDWSLPHDPVMRPSLEIYSLIGQSEFFDPDDPLAYESVKSLSGRSSEGRHYARDAWEKGLPMGVVAASDNHESHPGLNHLGLTAVFANELTRDAVFDALRGRHSYATTGRRILLDFELEGYSMGREAYVSGSAIGTILVAAPGPIAYAEIMAFNEGHDSWVTAYRWEYPGRLLQSEVELPVDSDTVVYLRAELVEKTNGRTARAWSSPIWLRQNSTRPSDPEE